MRDGGYTADFIECPHCKHIETEIHSQLDVGDLGGEYVSCCSKCGGAFNVDFYSVFWFKTTKLKGDK